MSKQYILHNHVNARLTTAFLFVPWFLSHRLEWFITTPHRVRTRHLRYANEGWHPRNDQILNPSKWDERMTQWPTDSRPGGAISCRNTDWPITWRQPKMRLPMNAAVVDCTMLSVVTWVGPVSGHVVAFRD